MFVLKESSFSNLLSSLSNLTKMTTAIANHSDSCLGPGHGRDYKVGTSVPANTPHAVSVSLPLWSDNVDYEEGRLAQVMEIGYPRFFIHKMIKEVSRKYSRLYTRDKEGNRG